MQPLANMIERIIKRGNAEGMQEKLNLFLLVDQITLEEYEHLSSLLQGE